MVSPPGCSCCVPAMTSQPLDVWDDAIRRHDRRIYLSVLALGIGPERAREIAQAAWTRLIEQHQRGALDEIELPGLAIRQARFLAFNELARNRVENRVLAAVPDPPSEPDVERVVGSRQEIERVLAALATCSPTAARCSGWSTRPRAAAPPRPPRRSGCRCSESARFCARPGTTSAARSPRRRHDARRSRALRDGPVRGRRHRARARHRRRHRRARDRRRRGPARSAAARCRRRGDVLPRVRRPRARRALRRVRRRRPARRLHRRARPRQQRARPDVRRARRRRQAGRAQGAGVHPVAGPRRARRVRARGQVPAAIPRFCASFQEDAGVHARYYLAQDLVVGEALDDRLETHWFSEAEIVGIARQVLDVLVYLQGLSPMVIHRDIKPANLLLRPDGTIAVVDFGAAHVHGMTVGTTAIGTFGYMPIEQLAGDVDATTDLYALGASLIHLLTRREPWRLLQDGLLADVPLNVSRALRAFLAKLVAPNPRDRFRSAADARTALDRLPGHRALERRPSERRPPERRALARWRLPRAAIVPAIIAAVVVVGAGSRAGWRVHQRTMARIHEASARAQAEAEAEAEAEQQLSRHEYHLAAGAPGTPQAALAEIMEDACRCTDNHCTEAVTHRLTAWGRDTSKSAEWLKPEAVKQVTRLSRQLSFCLARGLAGSLTDGIINLSGGPDKLVEMSHSGMLMTAVHDAVQAIGESCDINVVMSGQITSEVPGTLPRIRCDRALDLLLHPTGLDYEVRDAGIVRIAHRAELAAEHAARDDRARRGITADHLPPGRNVDLDFRQVPVRDLIHLLASAGGVEATLPDRLGTVTIHVTHLPWDRALVAILDASGLGYRYQDAGHRLRIAPIAEIDAELQRAAPHGFLEVRCTACTRFLVDGVDTPLPTKPLEISAGTHTIALFKSSNKTTWLIDIKPGATMQVGDPPFGD
ncbi:MAG: hypothetical protein E6J91_23460 [Deltaproteobacteria bacterium]|nr:MAG: hypothetical protein E6J91_23460 [Deltaproteobacteria bacterium]